MKLQERRNVIMDIIGHIPRETVLKYNPELSARAPMLRGTDLDTLRKSLSARKRKLNEEIKSKPDRIDELNNTLQELDFNDLENEATRYESSLADLEEDLLSYLKVNDAVLKDKSRLYEPGGTK